MGKNFRETLKEQMQDAEFKKEWEKTEQKYQTIKAKLTNTKTNIKIT